MLIIPHFISDINIIHASLPSILSKAKARGVLWQAASGRFFLNVPNVASYLVTAGNSITIDPAPDVLPSVLQHQMEMLPLAALSYQQGLLAFHAATVANVHGAVLITGDSGTGKSTLLAALSLRGWQVLADDLTIIGLNEQGHPFVYPTSSGISLWPDSLKLLGINSASFPRIDANRHKFTPSVRKFCAPQPLRAIFRLSVHSKSVVETEELPVNVRFRALGSYLYNSHVADALCDRIAYLRCMATIAESVSITIMRRPRGLWSVEALSDIIERNKTTR